MIPYQKTRANTSNLVELQQQPLGFLVVSTVLIVNLKPGPLRTDTHKYTHGRQHYYVHGVEFECQFYTVLNLLSKKIIRKPILNT